MEGKLIKTHLMYVMGIKDGGHSQFLNGAYSKPI